RDTPAHVHGPHDKQRDRLLDDRSGESKFEDISRRPCAAGMVQADPRNHCAAVRRPMASHTLPLKILLIENDPVAAEEICPALAAVDAGSFDLQWVRQLSDAFRVLEKKNIAAVLLELSLPDSQGIETFDRLFTAAPDVPILVLGGDENEELAKEAVGRGAQDYLLPGHLDSYSLPRAL